MQRYIFQNLWKSRLSYRQCSTLKQSIKDILNDDVTKESKKRVVAEVKRQLVSDMSEGSPLSAYQCSKLIDSPRSLQYSFHDGYIVRSNARSRKRLNPTLFPRLSHAKPALNPR